MQLLCLIFILWLRITTITGLVLNVTQTVTKPALAAAPAARETDSKVRDVEVKAKSVSRKNSDKIKNKVGLRSLENPTVRTAVNKEISGTEGKEDKKSSSRKSQSMMRGITEKVAARESNSMRTRRIMPHLNHDSDYIPSVSDGYRWKWKHAINKPESHWQRSPASAYETRRRERFIRVSTAKQPPKYIEPANNPVEDVGYPGHHTKKFWLSLTMNTTENE
ncbi:unnamed protein product [Calicophoron daubneyi]|uniref:Uncharacterized protein n=1 Tax=Calicophoron daubneyi TaxID=300641 RepID=A0AAV2SZC0_CALDB